ncbi:hypothetical protein YC2023_067522 [Brassica napus]
MNYLSCDIIKNSEKVVEEVFDGWVLLTAPTLIVILILGILRIIRPIPLASVVRVID